MRSNYTKQYQGTVLRIGVIALGAVLLSSGLALALAERMAVGSPVANIRSGPGSNYEIIWKVARYHPLVIVEKSGNWFRFKDFEGDIGWIHRSLVRKLQTLITAKPVCNVRSGPGTGHDIRFTVEKGIPFKRLKSKGNWIYIEHADGDRGWIHKSLVW